MTYCASGGVYRLTFPIKYVQTPVSLSTKTSNQRSSGGFGTSPGCTQGYKSTIVVCPSLAWHTAFLVNVLPPSIPGREGFEAT